MRQGGEEDGQGCDSQAQILLGGVGLLEKLVDAAEQIE